MELTIFVVLLAVWVLVGAIWWWFGTRTPRLGKQTLIRTADRKVARAGDRVAVTLHLDPGKLPPSPVAEQTGFRVLLMMDHSGSMGFGPGSPLQEAIGAANNFIERVAGGRNFIGVVAFDDHAQEKAPLSQSKSALFKSLQDIGPGGGTDIGLALDLAREMFTRPDGDPDDGVEDLAILLSDGQSAPQEALAAARQLGDSGVKLITIALGPDAGQDLMREMASSDDLYFQTLDPAELTRLYDHLARSLDEVRGSQVGLKEYYNQDRLVLSSFGDLKPFKLGLAHGAVQWFLPFLHSGDNQISYQLRPMRAGWYRLAAEPAQVKLLDGQGLSHEFTSNPGPMLLVLPSHAPLVLRWVLNPLAFWIWNFLTRRPARQPVVEEPRLPRDFRRPPEPELIDMPPASSTRLQFRPALVIGLGRLGGAALSCLKWEVDGLSMAMDQPAPLGLWRHAPGLAGEELDLAPHERWDECSDIDFNRLLSKEGLEAAGQTGLWDLGVPALFERYTDLNQPEAVSGERLLAKSAWVLRRDQAKKLLKERLESLFLEIGQDQPFDVQVILNSDEAVSGLLGDLLFDLRLVLDELGRLETGVSLVLVTAEASSGPFGVPDNCQALLRELEWLLCRPLWQAGHGQTPKPLDRVVVLEAAADLQAASQAASQHVLLWALSAEMRGHFFSLSQREAGLMAQSGQAVVHGESLSCLRLPAAELTELLTSRTLKAALGDRLLRVENLAERYVLADDEFTAQAADQALELLLESPAMVRPRPLLLQNLRDLSLNDRFLQVLQGLDRLLHDADQVMAQELLRQDLAALGQLLEEWLSLVLNGTLELEADANAEQTAQARSGRLAVAGRALAQLDGYCVQAQHLAAAAATGQFEQHAAWFSPQSLTQALESYRSCLAQVRQALEQWEWLLVDGPPANQAFKIGSEENAPGLYRRLYQSQERLSSKLKGLPVQGAVAHLCDEKMQEQIYKQCFAPLVDQMVQRLVWEPRLNKGGWGFELRLGLRGRGEQLFKPNASDVEILQQKLRDSVLGKIKPLSDLSVTELEPQSLLRLWDNLRGPQPPSESPWVEHRADGLHVYCLSEPGSTQGRDFWSQHTSQDIHDLQSSEPGRLGLLRSFGCQPLRFSALYRRAFEQRASGRIPVVWPQIRDALRLEEVLHNHGYSNCNPPASLIRFMADPEYLLSLGAALAQGDISRQEDQLYLLLPGHEASQLLTGERPAARGEDLLLAALAGWQTSGLGGTETGKGYLSRLSAGSNPFMEQGAAQEELKRLGLWGPSPLAQQLLLLWQGLYELNKIGGETR